MPGKTKDRGASVVSHADVETMCAPELRELWERRRGGPPPRTLSTRVLRVALAWDIQADAAGGESSTTGRQWRTVMQRRAEAHGAGAAVGGLSAPSAAAGTRLLKSWGGETHEVMVVDDGVVWNGRTYASLSAVARAITGTPKNGPKFFGLREGAS